MTEVNSKFNSFGYITDPQEAAKEKKDAKDVKVEAPKKSDEVLLLEEIRDLLKKES